MCIEGDHTLNLTHINSVDGDYQKIKADCKNSELKVLDTYNNDVRDILFSIMQGVCNGLFFEIHYTTIWAF